ncbi:MAG: nitrous oxide reductase accessory protein NosL [Rhodocyclaceae bacterium]|nr:nitrous oxide reductase accessory protein NosL [Rhodocyclaceae bacterium]
MNRRQFFADAAAAGFAFTPLAALLAGCAGKTLPEGMVEIKWDRDTCTRCSMVLSDRRFAAQVSGGPKHANFNFDDIGCAVTWLQAQPWGRDAATRIWVADVASRGNAVQWLDARHAQYVGGKPSPMGYNYGAVALAQAGSFDFDTMSEHILAKGKQEP